MNRNLIESAAAGQAFDATGTIRLLAQHTLHLEDLLQRMHPGLFRTDTESTLAGSAPRGLPSFPEDQPSPSLEQMGVQKLWFLAQLRRRITKRAASILEAAGLWDYDALCAASLDDLTALDGIGPATAATIQHTIEQTTLARAGG